MKTFARPHRLFIAGLVAMAALLVLVPLSESVLAVLPLRVGTLGWRLVAERALTSNLLTPLLGWSGLFGLAYVSGHRRTLGALSLLTFVCLLPLLGFTVLLLLDVVQARAGMPPLRLPGFELLAGAMLVKAGFAAVVLLLLGLGGWKSRDHRGESRSRTELVGLSASGRRGGTRDVRAYSSSAPSRPAV